MGRIGPSRCNPISAVCSTGRRKGLKTVFKHILCPVDGSDCSMEALKVATQFAAEQHACLTICVVVDPVKAAATAMGVPLGTAACLEALDEEADEIITKAMTFVDPLTPALAVKRRGQASVKIVDLAREYDCDMIVIGSHGRSGFSRALVGSVAEAVMRHTDVPVMIVRWRRVTAAPAAASASPVLHSVK